jgi:hypothetical protein
MEYGIIYYLTVELYFLPIPISVRQWRQFSQGSPALTGKNICKPIDMSVLNNRGNI